MERTNITRFTPAPLRKWCATVIEDNGETREIIVNETTYTQAYVVASLETNGIIIDLKEIKQ